MVARQKLAQLPRWLLIVVWVGPSWLGRSYALKVWCVRRHPGAGRTWGVVVSVPVTWVKSVPLWQFSIGRRVTDAAWVTLSGSSTFLRMLLQEVLRLRGAALQRCRLTGLDLLSYRKRVSAVALVCV